jgi:hypothetical protein
MKTINVSDEMYDSLVAISNELNTQNHRCTAMPYFFQIKTEDWEPCPEDQGEEVWFCDGSFLENDKEIKEAVIEYKEWDNLSKKEIENKYKTLKSFEIEEILEKNYRRVNRIKKEQFQNAFFTEKACLEHIKQNNYHYSNPVDYLTHAFRNPEMELVMKFLSELTGGKIHK